MKLNSLFHGVIPQCFILNMGKIKEIVIDFRKKNDDLYVLKLMAIMSRLLDRTSTN